MRIRNVLGGLSFCALALSALGVLLSLGAGRLGAQEAPARRLSSIVGVAVEEYGKGIDARGRVISEQEYQETIGFLRDARDVVGRLPTARVDAVRLMLDSITAAAVAKRPPAELAALHARFSAALGSEGSLELPARPLSLADGRTTYLASCARCHGDRGQGDGPDAAALDPRPPAIGNADTMLSASPALMYRIISVGVAGTSMPAWASTLSPQQRWDVVAYLQSLRTTPAALLEGEGLFIQGCAACHGPLGASDGAATGALTHVPPDIGSFAWQAERSDEQIARAVRQGLPGTAMPPSRTLGDQDVAKVVAYLRSIPVRTAEVAAAPAGAASDAAQVSDSVLAALDQALAAARAGRSSDAGDRAFDAYIAFEPLETPARARNPGLVAGMERRFADFKGAVRAKDMVAAQHARDAIEAGLPAVVALTHRSTGGWAAFMESFVIILREGFEAILVIGAVVAFLLKTGHRERLRSIWIGVGLGLLASAAMAVVLRTILSAMPASQEILEGITLLLAVAVLFSVSYWLISKVEAAKWQQFIRQKVSAALERGGGTALALVAFLAVFREGAETALFYQALFGQGQHAAFPVAAGIVVGFAALAVIFTLFYRFGVRIPLRPFFTVTSVVLYYMAFVFAGKGIRELQEGNAIGITPIPGLPHVEALGIYPTVETLVVQLLLLALFVFALLRTFWPKRAVRLPTVAPDAEAAEPLAERLAEMRTATEQLATRLAALESEREGAHGG